MQKQVATGCRYVWEGSLGCPARALEVALWTKASGHLGGVPRCRPAEVGAGRESRRSAETTLRAQKRSPSRHTEVSLAASP